MACRILNTCRRDPVYSLLLSVNDVQHCGFWYHHFLSLVFVFSQSRAKVSAGLTNVSGLAVAAFDLCIVLFNCLSFGLFVCMQLQFSGLCVLLTLLKANPSLWKFIRLTFTSYTDVDECKDDGHDCHVNGTCTNTAGSFKCVCNNGYFGDGHNCSGRI